MPVGAIRVEIATQTTCNEASGVRGRTGKKADTSHARLAAGAGGLRSAAAINAALLDQLAKRICLGRPSTDCDESRLAARR